MSDQLTQEEFILVDIRVIVNEAKVLIKLLGCYSGMVDARHANDS